MSERDDVVLTNYPPDLDVDDTFEGSVRKLLDALQDDWNRSEAEEKRRRIENAIVEVTDWMETDWDDPRSMGWVGYDGRP